MQTVETELYFPLVSVDQILNFAHFNKWKRWSINFDQV